MKPPLGLVQSPDRDAGANFRETLLIFKKKPNNFYYFSVVIINKLVKLIKLLQIHKF